MLLIPYYFDIWRNLHSSFAILAHNAKNVFFGDIFFNKNGRIFKSTKKKLWNFNMVLRCTREGYPDWKGKKKEKSFLFIEENVKIYIVMPFDDLIFSNCVFLWVNIPMTYEQKQFFHFLHFWRFDGKNCEKWGEIYMSTLLFF